MEYYINQITNKAIQLSLPAKKPANEIKSLCYRYTTPPYDLSYCTPNPIIANLSYSYSIKFIIIVIFFYYYDAYKFM